MSQPLLKMSQISKQIGVESGDLSGLELSLKKLTLSVGEQVAITGPSGSGKSTLLHLCAGLLTADKGDYLFDGHSMNELSHLERDAIRGQKMGMVFQNYQLLDAFTAYENVEVGLTFSRKKLENKKQAIEKALIEVGLEKQMHQKPKQMSLGQQQRVAIARALIHQPKLVLADEPTGALDPENADLVFTLLREYCQKKGAGLLMVTHDLKLADLLDRIFETDELIK